MLALSRNLAEVLQRVHGRWFPKVEVLTASREAVRDYQEGMQLGTQSPAGSLEFSADGSVRLAATSQQDITALSTGAGKFTQLQDDLSLGNQRALLYELDAARVSPLAVTKVTLHLHRKANGALAAFDGSFYLRAYRVQETGHPALLIPGTRWNLAPSAPIQVQASQVVWVSDEADVDFILPAPGIATDFIRQGTDRPTGKQHILFVLTIAGGTNNNTNAAWMYNTTGGESTTAGKGTLSWWSISQATATPHFPNAEGPTLLSTGGWYSVAEDTNLGRAAIYVRTNTGASATLTFTGAGTFDLGAAVTGDQEFAGNGETPTGTGLTYEVWNGTAWVAYNSGDRATIELPTVAKAQTRDLRVTFAGSTDNLRTPVLRVVGMRDVTAVDVSNLLGEELPDTFYQITDLVACKAEVAELTLRIVRHGTNADADDTITRIISSLANVSATHVRLSISAPGLARKDELHVDTYRVDDYTASDAALDLVCVSALDRLKLPIPKRALVSSNWVVTPATYATAGGDTLTSVFTDLRDGQLGLDSRYRGSVPQHGPTDQGGTTWSKVQGQVGAPGIGTAGKTELAKDVLEQLARIAGGVLSTSQGRIHYRDLFETTKVLAATFPEREIAWTDTPPGLRQRAPRVLVSFQPTTLGGKDWTKSIEREDGSLIAAIEQAGTEAGTQVDQIPDEVSRWMRCSAPQPLGTTPPDDAEGLADAVAHRHVRTYGAGLLVWGFTSRIPYPHLQFGDLVAAETSRFVGRDALLSREIRGSIWARGVIVGRNLWGTRFALFIRSWSDLNPTQRFVTQKGTYAPTVQLLVEDVDGRPDQARVRIRANPDDSSQVTIRYAVLDATAALPAESTATGTWTTYTAPVVVNRDAANIKRLVAWADWAGAWGPRFVAEIAPDRRPQILNMMLTGAHADTTHSDVAHVDVAHGDAAHADSHSDNAHDDVAHTDHHDDLSSGDPGGHKDGHWDVAHSDIAHGDSHSDTAHTDTAHTDTHTDVLHADGNYGTGVIVQADGDTGSVRVVARKHQDVAHADHVDVAVHSDVAHTDISDPSAADVRSQPAVDGRNVVVTLIDAATGGPLLMNPGDTAYIAGLAYSRAAAAGVEGPLALGRGSRFTVAPVGTDQWVPA